MKNKKILFHLLWIFISVLFVAGIGTALARYVITKTVYVTISTNATKTTGTVDYTITNEKDIYTVSDEDEAIEIKSTVKLENADNISTNAYYAWTTLNEEPTTDDYKSFTFDNNEYTIAKAGTKVGTYKLWVKVTYTSEVGEEKEVIKKSDAIKVVLGTINISLEDEKSDYLAGSVTANITYKGEYCENAVVGYGKTEEEAKSNAKEVTLTSKATTLTIETTDSETYYIYAYGEDTDGNSISAVRKIENIDNEKPTIDSITASYTRVKLKLLDNKSGVKYYTATTTNEKPTTYGYTLDTALTSVEDKYIEGLSPNTKYYIWVKDAAGNVTSQSITTKSVSYTVTPSGWTQSKTVKFSDLDNCTLTYTIGSDTKKILSYSKTDGITLTENTTINYILQDGENTVTGTINVTNIDTTSPTVEATSDYEKITLTANDTESSVSGYIVTNTEITNIESATFTSVNSTTSLSEEITQDYLGNSLKYDTTYYIYVKDVAGNITEAEVISNVDNTAPTLELGSTSSTTNSVKVTVNATDNESGIDTYTYYLSSTEDDFTGSEPIVSEDSSYTFERLEDNVKWYVKVIATDKAGNTSSEIETSIQTGELLIDEENTTVTFSDALWSSNEQTVTVTTSTGCKIKYQIVSPKGAISDNGWSDPIASGTQVTGLKNGDTLYVKIYDGINTSNNYATYSVKNEMAEKYSTITEEEMSKISEGEYDILTYSVTTSVATVSANIENESAKTYNYYIKNITSNTYELKMTSSSYDENVKIEEETEGQTYEIVLVELANDTEGTLSRSQNTSIVISREEATEGSSYSNNRSYTDSQNYVATVPAGFSVSSTEGENVISSGLVLKDTSGNEYVWVPVNDTISGKDADTSLITADSENLDELGFSSTESFKSYLETEYNNIKDSINTYKGFYVGRYETTTDSGTVGSKSGASILNGNWYTLYKYQNSSLYSNNSLNSSTAVSSTMIYGAEYDAMLAWMKTGKYSEKVTTSGLGNTTGAISTAGQYANDKINNIYDLSSNAYDLTVESSSDSRVYRGGGYNSSDAKSASDSSTISSTESGDIIGSRMAVYILSEGDTVAPTISLTLDPAGTKITAKVTATDVGTGVKNYYYSISSDGETWSEDTVSADNTHTFTGLSTKTTYYIRVKAVDKAGNSCEYIQASCTTDIIDVADDAITVHRIYGKDGEGIALLDLDDDYSSYYIEYQVVKKADAEAGKGVDVNGTWTQGDSVSGLSVGDIIYARVADDDNKLNLIFTITISELETYTDTYTETDSYTDDNGDTAYIPAGFKRGNSSINNTIDNGLVIEDADGNQFVWVPVDSNNVVYDGTTSIASSESAAKSDTSSYRPMARAQTGSNSKYYEGMFYSFVRGGYSYLHSAYKLGENAVSEPRLVLGISDTNYTWDMENKAYTVEGTVRDSYYSETELGFSDYVEMGKYMNEEYYNMINSVKKYGGFYIGRYETTLEDSSNNYSTSGTTVKTQNNKTSLTNVDWYKMCYAQDSNINENNPYSKSTSVVSSMIWGSQRHAALNWIITGNDKINIFNSSSGNHSGKVAKTGETLWDNNNNIIDLNGNISEWTMSGYNYFARFVSGGDYSSTSTAGGEGKSYHPQTSYANVGTRMTLYINDETDKVAPEISKRDGYESPEVTTNSIYVRVTAEDADSGIDYYVYSISSNGGTSYTDYKAYGNTYTFNNLNQNTAYCIKVKVIDKAGNESDEITYGIDGDELETSVLKIEETDIYADSLYGVDGSGKAYIGVSDTLEEQGYSCLYQVVSEDGTLDDSSDSWTSGRQVNNLNVGDTIYVKLTDGQNVSSTYGTINISELETYSEPYKATTEYDDGKGGKAYIPEGFEVGTSSINSLVASGLVIKNAETGDEFVWVPVENAIYDSEKGTLPSSTTSTSTYKPMAKYQSGSTDYFEGILYTYWKNSSEKYGSYAQITATSYALSSLSYREPSLVTGSKSGTSWKYTDGTSSDANSSYYKNILGFDSATDFGVYMNDEYANMVKSVAKYGGFYVGRYETSVSDKKMQSQIGTESLTNVNWYNMYYTQDSNINENNPYNTSTSVVSSMIWGSQWDAMLNWILDGEDKDYVYEATGNHSGSSSTTGQYADDFMNNILDLSSNFAEFTQEAYAEGHRVRRGASYSKSALDTTNFRYYAGSTTVTNYLGTRGTLYIKIEE